MNIFYIDVSVDKKVLLNFGLCISRLQMSLGRGLHSPRSALIRLWIPGALS